MLAPPLTGGGAPHRLKTPGLYYVQTNYNEVVVLQQGGDVLMKKWQVQK